MSQKRMFGEKPSSTFHKNSPNQQEDQFNNFFAEQKAVTSEYNFPEKQKSKYSKLPSPADSYQNESYIENPHAESPWKCPRIQHETQILNQTTRIPSIGFQTDSKDQIHKIVPIRFRTYDKTEYFSKVNIKLFFQQKHGKSIILFRLTREDDVQFIKILEMHENDFQKLRNEQLLRVDYSLFPKKFFELLELCCNSFEKEVDRVLFSCVIELQNNGSAIFRIIEQNEFKELDHLVLKFAQPDDEFVKHYLSDCLMTSRKNEKSLNAKIDDLHEEIQKKISTQEILEENMKNLKEEFKNCQQTFHTRLQEQQNEIESQYLNKLKHEFDEKEKIKKFYQESLIKNEEMSAFKIKELTTKYDLTNQQSIEAMSKNRELQSKLSLIELDYNTTIEDLKKNKLILREKESKIYEIEKEMTDLRLNYNMLESGVKDKEDIKNQHQETNKLLTQSITKQDEIIEDLKKQKEKLEKKLILSGIEIEKANEILENIELDNKKRKTHIKELKGIIVQQEKTINQSLEMQKSSKNENLSLTKIINEKELKQRENDASIAEYRVKVEELIRKVESDKVTITYLNERLREQSQPFLNSITNSISPSHTYAKNVNISSNYEFNKKLSSFGQNLLNENGPEHGRSNFEKAPSDDKEYDFLVNPTVTAPNNFSKKNESNREWNTTFNVNSKVSSVNYNDSGNYKQEENTTNSIYSTKKLTKTAKNESEDYMKYISGNQEEIKKFTQNYDINESFDQPRSPMITPTQIINPVKFNPPKRQI